MKITARALIILICLVSAPGLLSASTDSASGGRSPLPLVFPVFDAPFNLEDGYSFPSMDQSLMLCKNIGQLAHSVIIDGTSGLDTPLGRWLPFLLTGAFDYLYFYLPPGYAWLHEEWHRAVMSRRGISSYNDVYNFEIFAESIAVSHVKDDDLAALKLRHPAEMVRLHAAGNEADVELTLAMRRDSFFTGRPVRYDLISWWLNLANTWAYIHLCTTSEADLLTDESNAEDGTDISRRDFTGLDFTAWVYDLFRPGEPYAARGVHPSGVGIDRYIRRSDLTDEEKDYLRLQRNLALLNFLSPQMAGIDRFAFRDPFTGGSLRFNFAVTHHLTCFGYDAAAHLFFREGDISLAVTPHLYANRERNLPGLDVSIVRYRVDTAPITFFASATAALWLQPRDLLFRDSGASPGGLFRIAFSFPAGDRVEFHLQGETKTRGWYAGVVYLDAAFQARAGVTLLW
jgi:hypothetical protein